MAGRAKAERPADQVSGGSGMDGRSLDRALDSDDPGVGLRAVVALRAVADQLELLHVDRARAQGWPWQEIANVLGISKQAVHKKYGRRQPTRDR